MTRQVRHLTSYQRQHPVLDMLGKLLLNPVIAGMLLGLGFILVIFSNIGPAYLPDIKDGALDGYIRFTMLTIGAIIWLITPIWFLYSSIRYGYKSYRTYKRIHPKDTSS